MADLIDLGTNGFRPLVLEHPALYRIAFQRAIPGMQAGPELTAARTRAWEKSVPEAAVEFNAMLEGLGNAELRGAVLRNLPEGDEERAWRDALATVIRGFSAVRPNDPTS